MTFNEWVEKMNTLDADEKAFVFSIINRNGCKYPFAPKPSTREDKPPLWDAPEKIGLINCVGSWKWELIPVQFEIEQISIDNQKETQ